MPRPFMTSVVADFEAKSTLSDMRRQPHPPGPSFQAPHFADPELVIQSEMTDRRGLDPVPDLRSLSGVFHVPSTFFNCPQSGANYHDFAVTRVEISKHILCRILAVEVQVQYCNNCD